jgi:hypothetical protein
MGGLYRQHGSGEPRCRSPRGVIGLAREFGFVDQRALATGLGVGIAIGVVIGLFMDNIAVGIAIGVALGVAFAYQRR